MDRTVGWALVALGAMLLVALVAGPLAMMGGMMGAPTMGFPFGMLVVLLVPILLIVLLTVLGLRRLGQGTPPASSPRGESPLDILDRRYASGDIEREEYERIRADLRAR